MEKYVVHLKQLSPAKSNAENRIEIDPYTATQCLFEPCTPRTHNAPDSGVTKKIKYNIFALAAGTRSTIFPKLYIVTLM